MKVFVAGATGAVGKPLLQRLVEAGHVVTGMTSSARGEDVVRALGAEAVVADALDAKAVDRAIREAEPEVVIDELTKLPADPTKMAEMAAADEKLRLEGGGHLLRSACKYGVRRYMQQASAFYLAGEPGETVNERAPLAVGAGGRIGGSARRYAEIERRLKEAPIEGVLLRYGFFYGPGTWFHPDGGYADLVRAGAAAVVGEGQAMWNWIHVDDAAEATVDAMDAEPGTYNLVEDEPVAVRVWLPGFARVLRAPEPPRMSVEEARERLGEDAVFAGTGLVGASNAKARAAWGFAPRRLAWLQA